MQLHAALLLTLFAVASAQLRCSVDTACKQDYAAFTFETEGAVTVGCSYLTSTGTSPAVKDALCADPTIKVSSNAATEK